MKKCGDNFEIVPKICQIWFGVLYPLHLIVGILFFYKVMFSLHRHNFVHAQTYCVSQKEREWENQRPCLKMCPPFSQFCFWFSMSSPWAVCVRNFLNQSNWFENVALNMDTNKTPNLELLLSAVDFHFFGAHMMFPLCVPSSVAKINITNRYF